jgi:hypothetical protein
MDAPKLPSGLFFYRHNPDGTWDSICLHCYMTAASSPSEDELQTLERLHICSPQRVSEATVLRGTLMTLRDLLESPSLSLEVRAKITEVLQRLELGTDSLSSGSE